MKRYLGISLVTCCLLLVAGFVFAKPVEKQELTPTPDPESYLVGDVDGTNPSPAKALQDTVWIADWNFEPSGSCNSTGWVKYDNRILNTGQNYWIVSSAFADTFGIVGPSAILRRHDLTWPRDGYGNDWDYSVILKYRRGTGADPAPSVAFDYLSDSEPSYDFVHIEADSAGASESRVNYNIDPGGTADQYRTELAVWDGVQHASYSNLALPDFTVPGTVHKLYIRFTSDGAYS